MANDRGQIIIYLLMHLKYLYAAESIANLSTVHLGILGLLKIKIEVVKNILED